MQWIDQSTDDTVQNVSRWNQNNIDEGWDLDDVMEEFDEFFEQNDDKPDGLNKEMVEVELQKSLGLYEKGISSGKVDDSNEFDSDDNKARFK